MRTFVTILLATCGRVLSQSTTSTDSSTQITFQSWTHSNGFKFSLALPETGENDLIAQIQAPLRNSIGWAGISLGPAMLNNTLLVTWSNNGKLQSSIRKTTKYGSPPVLRDTQMQIHSIASGTSANTTHLTHTFLCSGCIPKGNALGSKLGWAMSTSAVPTPGDVETKFGYHMAGFGTFDVDVEKAKNSGFAGWAAKAS